MTTHRSYFDCIDSSRMPILASYGRVSKARKADGVTLWETSEARSAVSTEFDVHPAALVLVLVLFAFCMVHVGLGQANVTIMIMIPEQSSNRVQGLTDLTIVTVLMQHYVRRY